MSPTLNIVSYPEILDSVLFYLHSSGSYATLATCRLLCNHVKANIDRRLPEHITLNPKRNPRLRTIRTRFWALPVSPSWRPTGQTQVLDIYDPRRRPCIQLHSSETPDGDLDVVRTVLPGYCPLYPIHLLVVFPVKDLVELPITAERIVLNLRFKRGSRPCSMLFRYHDKVNMDAFPGWKRPKGSMVYPVSPRSLSGGPKHGLNVKQELVLMITPTDEEFPWEGQWFEGGDFLEPSFWLLFHNVGLKVTVVGMEEWDWRWFRLSDEGRRRCEAVPEEERMKVAWEVMVEEETQLWRKGPRQGRSHPSRPLSDEVFEDRIELVSKDEWKRRVGSQYRLMEAP